MNNFQFSIDANSTKLKYLQLVDAISEAISNKDLQEGDLLPSVNYLIKECSLSRDTVFKAYGELKNRGLILSVPNRGYFVAHANTKVLLFLDTFKAYKEVLYASFTKNLPNNIGIDLQFHHYNIELFERTIDESIGKYSAYIIMSFDHKKMKTIMSKLPIDKLLVIDWQTQCPPEASSVYQSFGKGLYDALASQPDIYDKYHNFIFLYPEFTNHPKVSINMFKTFCNDFCIKHKVLNNTSKINIKTGDLYLLVSDRTLSMILDRCTQQDLVVGKDVGIISYNETPMKKYINGGISVVTTNFNEMGKLAANFVINNEYVYHCVPTKLIKRSSLL